MEFYKNRGRKDGLTTWCKECDKESTREWNKRNVEHTREYRQKHKERDRRTTKIYEEKNREKIRARHRRYQEANKEKIRERSRAYRQTPQGRLAKKISDHHYYARKMNCKINDLTTDQARLLLKKTTHCAVCLKRFKKNEGRALDHIVPLSKDGNNTLLNLQISHLPCNSRKGNRHYANYGDGQLLLIPIFQESPFKKPEPIVLTEKKCNRCKVIKPIDSFHKNKATRDRHSPACKQCMKISGAKFRKKHKEYLVEHPEAHLEELEKQCQWRKEKVKQDPDYYKKCYYRDVEGNRRRSREHKERNPEYYREYAQGYSGKYYEKNKLKIQERSRKYHSEHKEQQNESCREWRRNHPDYNREWRHQHPDYYRNCQGSQEKVSSLVS